MAAHDPARPGVDAPGGERDHYRALVAHSQALLCIHDLQGRVISVNDTGAALLGYAQDELAGTPLAGLVPDPERDELARYLATVVEQGEARGILCLLGRDGERRYFQYHSTRHGAGEGREVVAYAQDVTELVRTQGSLRRRDAILAAVAFAGESFLHGGTDADHVQRALDRLGAATAASRAYLFRVDEREDGSLRASQLHEWVAAGIEPQIANPDLQDADFEAQGFRRWMEALGRGEPLHGAVESFPAGERELLAAQSIRSLAVVPVFVRRRWWGFLGFDECRQDREWSPVEVDALRAAADLLGAALFREQVEERMVHDALHDPLTGLPNRSLFLDRLQVSLDLASREHGEGCAVLLVGLDGIRPVNETLGHATADELLVDVGRRLTAARRPGDSLARVGDDRFALLLEAAGSPLEVMRTAQALHRRLELPFAIGGRELFAGAAIGIVSCSGGAQTARDVLRDAQVALDQARRSGRGQSVLFSPEMHRVALARFQLEGELRRAVDSGALSVWYQPVVDLRDGGLLSREALLRWHHPERGLLAPGAFLEVAVEAGLMGVLGRWVLGEACRQARLWQAEAPGCAVRVNLHAVELSLPGLVDHVEATLQRIGLDPGLLDLELTEHAVMADPGAIRLLRRLRGLGVGISLDDFGAGYSSFAQLHELPLTTLKADRSFVARLGGGGQVLEVLAAIRHLAHSLGLQALAEGVERTEQRDALVGVGYDAAQGYLFGRPAPWAGGEAPGSL